MVLIANAVELELCAGISVFSHCRLFIGIIIIPNLQAIEPQKLICHKAHS